MGRFFSLTFFLVIATAVILQFHIEVPWLSGWIGKLPGDLLIKKGGIVLYCPLSSSVLISVSVTVLLTLLFGKAK